MPLLRLVRDAEYLPDYGMVVVRDGQSPDPDFQWPPAPPLLGEHEDQQPGDVPGTLGRSGAGWLYVPADDRYTEVELEAHDSVPDEDDAWPDLVDLPYLNRSGVVALEMLTGGSVGDDLLLGAPGRYRVRVARRAGEDGLVHRLQFWPDQDDEPPRWIRRSQAAVRPGSPGWDRYLPYPLLELTWLVSAVGDPLGASLQQIRRWAYEHGRPADWLDEAPFAAPLPRPTTGHADLDRQEEASRQQYAARLVKDQRLVDDMAQQLSMPPARTRREMLDLFVAAGLLERSGDRYQPVAALPRVQDVLNLAPERVAELERIDESQRFGALIADVACHLSWQDGAASIPIAVLSARLSVPRTDLVDLLTSSTGQAVFAVEGQLEGQDPVTIALRGHERTEVPPPPPAPVSSPPSSSGASSLPPPTEQRPPPPPGLLGQGFFSSTRRPDEKLDLVLLGEPAMPGDALPTGPPPRAGLITTDGQVVQWRGGHSEVITRLSGTVYSAVESRFGTIVVVDSVARLVRENGWIDDIGPATVSGCAIDSHGRHVAVTDWQLGRRSRYRIYVVDLATGSRVHLPWEDQRMVRVVAMHNGVVYFTPDVGPVLVSDQLAPCMSWRPGSEPAPLPNLVREVDPITGNRLELDEAGVRVTTLAGRSVQVAIQPIVRLAPGGTKLYSGRLQPSALTLFELGADPHEPDVFVLPPDSAADAIDKHVWEDREHVLVLDRPWSAGPMSAVRLNVGTGAVERVPLGEAVGEQPLLIRPLLSLHDA